MDDIELQLLIDLHRDGYRQGPGSDAVTQQTVQLAGLDRSKPLQIADIGCGTGASSIQLAATLQAKVTAVDFLLEFLEILQARAEEKGVSETISTCCCSMDALPFADEELDVIWSEGAIYNIGFEKGISTWRKYLKPGGLLAVTEITWLTDSRPEELESHWMSEYPEINVASAKLQLLERHGYKPIGYFVLPERCWLTEYYEPMQRRFPGFLQRHSQSSIARKIIKAEEQEMALFQKYKLYYSYGCYLARKL
jgi:ubiquinone/menaquinone biosynthesis C-methylase UbiE